MDRLPLPQLQNEELSYLDFLASPTQFYASNTNNSSSTYGDDDNIVERDTNLGSPWLNAPSVTGFNLNIPSTDELFSDTESLTSCCSAVASPAIFDNTDEFRFLPDPELKDLSVKELNHKVKGLPKDVIKSIKKRRRTLKNRGYAHSCRIKRIEEKSNLQQTKAELEGIIGNLKEQVTTIKNERDLYKNRYETIVRHIMKIQHMKA